MSCNVKKCVRKICNSLNEHVQTSPEDIKTILENKSHTNYKYVENTARSTTDCIGCKENDLLNELNTYNECCRPTKNRTILTQGVTLSKNYNYSPGQFTGVYSSGLTNQAGASVTNTGKSYLSQFNSDISFTGKGFGIETKDDKSYGRNGNAFTKTASTGSMFGSSSSRGSNMFGGSRGSNTFGSSMKHSGSGFGIQTRNDDSYGRNGNAFTNTMGTSAFGVSRVNNRNDPCPENPSCQKKSNGNFSTSQCKNFCCDMGSTIRSTSTTCKPNCINCR